MQLFHCSEGVFGKPIMTVSIRGQRANNVEAVLCHVVDILSIVIPCHMR